MRQDKTTSQDTSSTSSEPPAPAAPPAPVKTAEAWAEAKGMLPQFFEPEVPQIPAELRNLPSVGVTMGRIPSRRHNAKHALYVGARMTRNWPLGKEVTEAEFDAAVTEAMSHGAV